MKIQECINKLDEIPTVRFLNRLIEKKRCTEIKFYGCVICGRKYRLQIHHINYAEDSTMLLCRYCHCRVHFGKGFEHLNPVGKKQWLAQMKTLERVERTALIEEELKDMGYVRLARRVFNKPDKVQTKQNFRIIGKGYVRE